MAAPLSTAPATNMQKELIQIFNYGSNQVRVMMKDNNPWFVAKDLCEILDIKWAGQHALIGISEKNKGIEKFSTPGGMQAMLVVSEAGMYRLIMRSTKPEAEKFQDWIAEEVLPSIRRTGTYAADEVSAR